jgi:sugar-specific transcriptional regulator TrmB
MAVPSAQASTNVKVGSITSWIPTMNDCKAIKHIVIIIIELMQQLTSHEQLTSMNSCSDRILCSSSMTSSTADEREEAQIREDTESAYVKMFTTDMVTLESTMKWGRGGGSG